MKIIVIKIKETNGSWIFIVPVSNLILSKEIGQEYRIRDVTFISAEKLPYVRKKLGFPSPISKIMKGHKGHLNNFFSENKTFAIVRITGRPIDFEFAALKKIREELEILSLSQLGYAKRRINFFPTISHEMVARRRSYLSLESNGITWYDSHERVGKIGDLVLDKSWYKFQKEIFFVKLIEIIRGENRIVKQTWSKELRKAVLLAGQSQCSIDLSQAFLWNMIALELLLTEEKDSYLKSFPKRVESFIGWSVNWEMDKFEDKINRVYKKRCEFVHRGERNIELEDLFFTDDLLFNLLCNIVNHTNIFKSKTDIIDFSKRVEAEKLLGISPAVQPKTFKYLKRSYMESDYKKSDYL